MGENGTDIIKSVYRVSTENYDSDRYDHFWEQITPPAGASRPAFALEDFQRQVLDVISTAKQVVCIFTDEINSNALCEALLALSQQNVRVYLIINDCRDKSGTFPREKLAFLRVLATKCSIRLSSHIRGHFVLIDPDHEAPTGFITNSNLMNLTNDYASGNYFLISLNKKQIKDAFKSFKSLFWFHSDFEIIEESDLTSPKPVTKPPFEEKKLEGDAFVLESTFSTSLSQNLLRLLNSLEKDIRLSLEHFLIPEDLKDVLFKKIQTLPGPNMIVTAREFWLERQFSNLDQTTQIFGLPSSPALNYIMGDESSKGMLVLNYFQGENYGPLIGLTLDKIQLKSLNSFLKYQLSNCKFQYFYEKSLSQIQNQIFVLNKDGEFESVDLRSSEEVNLGDFRQKTIDDFLEMKDKQLDLKKYKKRFRKNITYKWSVSAPILPKEAERDSLYDEWETAQKNFENLYSNISERIANLKAKMEENRTPKLTSIITGKIVVLNNFEQDLKLFSKIDLLSLPIEQAKLKSNTLLEFNAKIKNEENLFDTKLDFDKNITRIEDLNRNLETQLESLKQKIEEIKNSQIEEQNKKELKEKEIKELEIKINKEKKKKKDDLEQDLKSEKAILKKLNESLKEIEEDLESKSREIEKKEDEIKKNNSEIKNLQIQIESDSISSDKKAKDSLRDIFRLGKDKTKEKPVKENVNASIEIPKEKLPTTGSLHAKKRDRFLAIEYYSQIDDGKHEAGRIKAQLVVKK